MVTCDSQSHPLHHGGRAQNSGNLDKKGMVYTDGGQMGDGASPIAYQIFLNVPCTMYVPMPYLHLYALHLYSYYLLCSHEWGQVSDNTCQTASRGLVGSLKPVFTRGEVLATVNSLMGLAVGLRCGGNV